MMMITTITMRGVCAPQEFACECLADSFGGAGNDNVERARGRGPQPFDAHSIETCVEATDARAHTGSEEGHTWSHPRELHCGFKHECGEDDQAHGAMQAVDGAQHVFADKWKCLVLLRRGLLDVGGQRGGV